MDGIVVATPAGSHLSDAATAAERGVPSLVEKPPGLDLAEACALRALTPPPSIGFNRRFDPAVRRARSACDARSRARIVVELCGDTRAWAAHEPPPDALLDLGSHAADLAVHVSGRRPVSVRTVSLTPVSGLLEVELDGGGAALLYISNSGRWSERLEVVDRDGRQLARSSRGGMRGRLLARLRLAPGLLPATLRAQLEAFALSLGGAHPEPLASAEDGVTAMALLDAARRSAASGSHPVLAELPG